MVGKRQLSAWSILALFGVTACSSADEKEAALTQAEQPAREDVDVSSKAAVINSELEAELSALHAALEANPEDPEVQARRDRFNAKTDQAAGLLLEVKMDNDHVVSFYEPAPGAQMIIERSKSGGEPVFAATEARSFEQLYRHMRPNEVVPAVLLEADARTKRMAAEQRMPTDLNAPPEQPVAGAGGGSSGEDPGNSGENPGNGVVEKHATSSCVHFRDDHNSCPVSDSSWCVCNITGNTSGWRSGVTHSYQKVGLYSGASISWTVSMDESSNGPWTYAISQGEIWWASMTSSQSCGCPSGWWACGTYSYCSWTHRGSVTNATNRSYHWGACFDYGQSFNCP